MKKIPKTQFSTVFEPETQRFEAYTESIGLVFDVDVDKSTREDKNFYARIDSYLIDEMMLIDCQTLGQKFLRSRAKIAQDGLDHILVQFFTQGGTKELEHASSEVCTEGSLIFIDTSRPWKAYNPEFRTLTLVIPRRFFRQHQINASQLHGKVVALESNFYASLLWNFVRNTFLSLEKIQADQSQHLMSSHIELVLAIVKSQFPSSTHREMSQDVMLIQVKQFIEQNLSRSDLSVEMICQNFRISRSTLYRLFPMHLGGVSRYIKQRRLEFIYRRLLNDRQGELNISDLAFRYGFESLSSFSRSFKKIFHQTPKDVQMSSKLHLESSNPSSSHEWHKWYSAL